WFLHPGHPPNPPRPPPRPPPPSPPPAPPPVKPPRLLVVEPLVVREESSTWSPSFTPEVISVVESPTTPTCTGVGVRVSPLTTVTRLGRPTFVTDEDGT